MVGIKGTVETVNGKSTLTATTLLMHELNEVLGGGGQGSTPERRFVRCRLNDDLSLDKAATEHAEKAFFRSQMEQ